MFRIAPSALDDDCQIHVTSVCLLLDNVSAMCRLGPSFKELGNIIERRWSVHALELLRNSGSRSWWRYLCWCEHDNGTRTRTLAVY